MTYTMLPITLSDIHHFADDTNLLYSSKSLNQRHQQKDKFQSQKHSSLPLAQSKQNLIKHQ